MDLTSLTPQQLRRAAEMQEQIAALKNELAAILRGQSAPTYSAAPAGRRPQDKRQKRKLSPEGRAAIIAATKARWAKIRAGKAPPPKKVKRTISSAGLAAISAAARARWAKIKAAKK